MLFKVRKLFFLMQYIKNNKLIDETDKSLKNGPVIKNNGIKENNKVGILKKRYFSSEELKIIKE